MTSQGLFEKLTEYCQSDAYGFHMPGHKRNLSFPGALDYYGIDITEIRDFDDLHHPEGILMEAQQMAAELFHAEESHLLVNGSTVGILSAILGSTNRGDKIIVARNCHKSVYNGIYMQELKPLYVYPDYDEKTQLNGAIAPEDIAALLKENPDTKAVMIVSPTYDGVLSDVKTIAEIVHQYQIPLIVDEAHGAHLGFHPYFPENSCQCGADIVIHSLHKTLPSPTQTAAIHLCGSFADRTRVRRYLHMLQSSSPSYLLMAGMDRCLRVLADQGEHIFQEYADLLANVRARLKSLSRIQIVETPCYDRSKLVISVANADISSKELSEILWKRYHLEFEMTAGSYLLAMTSVCDTKEGLERLVTALEELDQELGIDKKDLSVFGLPKTKALLTIAESMEQKENGRYKLWEMTEGDISTEYAYVYPPGIPVVVPGEIITREAIDVLQWYRKYAFRVEGPEKEGCICVLERTKL